MYFCELCSCTFVSQGIYLPLYVINKLHSAINYFSLKVKKKNPVHTICTALVNTRVFRVLSRVILFKQTKLGPPKVNQQKRDSVLFASTLGVHSLFWSASAPMGCGPSFRSHSSSSGARRLCCFGLWVAFSV